MRLKSTFIICLFCFMRLEPACSQGNIQKADSFFFASDWNHAAKLYKDLLKDTLGSSLHWNRLGLATYNTGKADEALKYFQKALALNPPAALKIYAYSRIARIYSAKNDRQKTFQSLDSAIASGYINYIDLDSLPEYSILRNDAIFRSYRDKLFKSALPCMSNPKAREFDFWVGEWNAYTTGTNYLAGQSIIQIAAGGCMILENWVSENQPYSGKSINFIDTTTGKWQQVWVGSDGGGQSTFINGEYKDSIMQFEYDRRDSTGERELGRFRFYNQGPNQVRQLMETSADNGKTWNPVYDFTYIRKP